MMEFKIGDRVVHPQHGVGYVVKLQEREFEPGVMRRYYEVAIPGATVWVPMDLSISGWRKEAGLPGAAKSWSRILRL
jgi:RNA polymerase-interacting CarD/CdnL/TRCF family regulator